MKSVRKTDSEISETSFQKQENANETVTAIVPLDAENGVVVSRSRLLKNLTVLGIAITLHLFGVLPCKELQSSIRFEDGLGAITLAIQLGSGILSQLFFPPLLIKFIGLKNTIIFSLLMPCVYYFANLYPCWCAMVLSAVISGFGMVPIWAAKGTYLTGLSNLWAKNFNATPDSTASLIFGCFYGFYYFGYVLGNTISYVILFGTEPKVNVTDENCGLKFVDSDVNLTDISNFQPLPTIEYYELFGAFIGMAFLAAAIIWFFLDTMNNSKAMEVNPKTLVFKILKALKDPNQLMVLPISVQRGILKSFYSSEFSKAYVTCSWGVQNVGLTMMGFGLVCCISSIVFGHLMRWVGRLPIFTLAFLLHFAVLTILLQWEPDSAHVTLFFVVPCLLAVSNAVWESQVAGMYTLLFHDEKEVSFTIYAMAEDVGDMISYAYSTKLPFYAQLAIFMTMVVVSFVSYLITESKFVRGKINGYDFRTK